ncbi:MAG: hypothetical protein AB3P07_06490 [Wolbachia pipientis]
MPAYLGNTFLVDNARTALRVVLFSWIPVSATRMTSFL